VHDDEVTVSGKQGTQQHNTNTNSSNPKELLCKNESSATNKHAHNGFNANILFRSLPSFFHIFYTSDLCLCVCVCCGSCSVMHFIAEIISYLYDLAEFKRVRDVCSIYNPILLSNSFHSNHHHHQYYKYIAKPKQRKEREKIHTDQK
jgi:hypothetical protein